VEKATRHRDSMAARVAALDRKATGTQKSAARRALADAKRRLPGTIKEAQTLIAQSLALLDKLTHLKSTDDARHQSTMERQSLIGSAFKRRALVNLAAGRSDAVVRGDLLKMKKAYAEARKVGAREPGADLFYSASNLLASDIALDRSGRKALQLDSE